MKLEVLSSGSKSNCYILHGKSSSLIIECGVKFNEIKRMLNFDLSGVIGCLVTHNHKDHSKSIGEVLTNGIPVCCSRSTAGDIKHHNLNIIEARQQFDLGEFRILSFDTQHDAPESLGFLIQQKSTQEKLLFATDTYYIKYKFKGLNYIMIECNYDREILECNVAEGIINKSLKERIEQSHFSLENVKKFLAANDISNVKKIVLLHLSEKNSDELEFKKAIEELTGIETIIAKKDVKVDLELYPF